MADQQPWLPAKFQAFSAMVAAEAKLYARILDLLSKWAGKLRTAVFGHSGATPSATVPDPLGVRGTTTWFSSSLEDDGVLVEIREIFDFASADFADPTPNGAYRAQQAVAAARNRLVRIPDGVYAQVRAQTMKATTEGWSIDELAAGIDEVLAEAGAERWKNRARTIARTEAVAAYNGGTYSGFLSYAEQLGGSWEKVWLETHDHRTRTTHRETTGFGGQRVPLTSMFRANGVDMLYPGWPGGPPEEVINCRCSILLVREGEQVDYSNRQYKGGA